MRLRHTLVDQRGEWQQRIRAVLYHHGLPNRRELYLLSNEATLSLGWFAMLDSAYDPWIWWRVSDEPDV